MTVLAMCAGILTLQRHTPRQGGAGGQKESTFVPDPNATEVQCDIQPATADTKLKYMQDRMVVSHTLYFDWDYSPNIKDRWVDDNGLRVFIVQGWYNSLERNNAWVCDALEQRVPRSPGKGSV